MKTQPLRRVPARSLSCLAAVLAFSTLPATAQVPAQLNYQGRVVVDQVNYDGTGQFKFAIVGPTTNQNQTATATPLIGGLGDGMGPRVISIAVLNGGSGYLEPPTVTINDATGTGATATATVVGGVVTEIAVTEHGLDYTFATTVTLTAPPASLQAPTYWSTDGVPLTGFPVYGTEPATAVAIPVLNGLYAIRLGDASLAGMPALPAGLFHERAETYLRVWFNDGVHGSQLLSPDQRLVAVPYALEAGMAQNVVDGAITTGKLAAGAITPSLLLSGAGPQAGQVLSFNGSQFNWIAPAGGGQGGNFSLPYSANGSAAGNSSLFSLSNSDDGFTIFGQSSQGTGLFGQTFGADKAGVLGRNEGTGQGVFGYGSGAAVGVAGISEENDGVSGRTNANGKSGVYGYAAGDSAGVYGFSEGGDGIRAHSNASNRSGLVAVATGSGSAAVFGYASGNRAGAFGYGTGGGPGVLGVGDFNDGVSGRTNAVGKAGVFGYAALDNSAGVNGTSVRHHGVYAYTGSTNRAALWATAPNGPEAIHGHSEMGDGVVGYTNAAGKSGIFGLANRSDNNGVAAINDAGTGLFAKSAAPGGTAGFFWNSGGGDAIRTTGNVVVGGRTKTQVLEITGGADLAEPFAMKDSSSIPKGSVVVISEDGTGTLERSTQAYDTRVAGIVSGANGIQPGISLHQEGINDEGHNVALTGRVYCLCDATDASIKPGDMLTTSSIPGHAMKVQDPTRAQGAVLGKAMSVLPRGEKGHVLVLVTLQ